MFKLLFNLLICLLLSLNVYANLPCDLQEIKKTNYGYLPKLYLSGEIHDNFYCVIDKYVHREFAKQNELIMGSEGLLFGEELDGNFGLEEPVSLFLAISIGIISEITMSHELKFMYLNSSRFVKAKLEDKKVESNFQSFFGSHVLDNPILNEIWQEFREKQKANNLINFSENQILATLDEYLKRKKSNPKELSRLVDKLNLSNKIEILSNFCLRFATAAINAYNDKYRNFYSDSPLEKFDISKMFNQKGSLNEIYTDQFLINLRNEFMAINIGKIYCAAAREKKSLIIFIGKDHIPGMRLILERLFGNLISIVDRDSRQACQDLLNSKSEGEVTQILRDSYDECNPSVNLNKVIDTMESKACIIHAISDKVFLRGTPKYLHPIRKLDHPLKAQGI